MNILIESIIASFDSSADITWSVAGPANAIARLSVAGAQVLVMFIADGQATWRVGFDVDSKLQLGNGLAPFIRVFRGIFQAVGEFLEVRQPECIVFDARAEALGELFATYMTLENTKLRDLGYRASTSSISSPAEFSVTKTTPSEWMN